ncbi:MAG: hypothetical protein ACWA6U_16695 [Breznakibacter sp.]
MKHPLEKCRKAQETFLKNCPEEQREFHAYLFRIGNASYIYHSQATKEIKEESLKIYYEEWLSGLPGNIREGMKARGFEACKTVLSFTRYVNERTDIGMTDWMREHLSSADFREWIGAKEKGE